MTPQQQAMYDALPVAPLSPFAKRELPTPVVSNPGVMAALTSQGRALYRPLTYLACPYTADTAKLRRERFAAAIKAAKYLMESEGLNVFSPITHSHPLHEIGMRGDWEFWKRIDTEYLRLSEKVVVLMMPGWVESAGVTAEIKLATSMGIPVEYLSPKLLDL
jgi:hypothetical protein